MPVPRERPLLMIIGDSLAQGCRSLTVSRKFCSQSYGAVIADSQGWPFAAPDFPRELLFDLERVISRVDLVSFGLVLPRVLRRIGANLRRWNDGFAARHTGSARDCFDNLAVAGCSLDEMTSLTSAGADERLAGLDRTAAGLVRRDQLSEAHRMVNARFVLNPGARPAYMGWSQLEWVRRRKPRCLLVHGGHNNGLYAVGGSGKAADLIARTQPAYLKLIDEIAALPAAIEKIVFILLPKISAVANLHPHGAFDPATGYFAEYRTVFPRGGIRLAAAQLAAMDAQIRQINREARLRIEAADTRRRIRIVDGYSVFDRLDYKNTRHPARQLRIGARLIDNRYLASKPKPHVVMPGARPFRNWRVWSHGGLQGIDGMHLSAVGYAVLAIEIMREMNLPCDAEKILRNALAREPLINRYPSGLDDVIALLGGGGPDAALDPVRLQDDALTVPEAMTVMGRVLA